jgi:hypothetical protein
MPLAAPTEAAPALAPAAPRACATAGGQATGRCSAAGRRATRTTSAAAEAAKPSFSTASFLRIRNGPTGSASAMAVEVRESSLR